MDALPSTTLFINSITSASSAPSTTSIKEEPLLDENTQLTSALELVKAGQYQQALEIYKPLAANNNAQAQCELGRMYFHGYGVKQDYAEAMACFHQSAKLGYAAAYGKMGLLHEKGHGVQQDYEEAMACYQQGAKLGCGAAYNSIGHLYKYGHGVQQDYAEAMRYFQQGAKLGYGLAYHNVGRLYAHGHGVQQDYAEAMRCFRQGAEHGCSAAYFKMGVLYAEGRGVEQDYVEAMKCFQQAAKRGSRVAYNDMGLLYAEGHGVKQNYAEAMSCFQQGAKLGCSTAYCNMGVLYEKGLGVTQDYAVAIYCYVKANELGNASGVDKISALQEEQVSLKNSQLQQHFNQHFSSAEDKNPESQLQLGLMYAQGMYVKQCDTKAMAYFILAYNNEISTKKAESALMLGYLELKLDIARSYFYRNVDQALDWYKKAVEAGHKEAAYKVGLISIEYKKEEKEIVDNLTHAHYVDGHPNAALTLSEWYKNRSFFPNEEDANKAKYWLNIAKGEAVNPEEIQEKLNGEAELESKPKTKHDAPEQANSSSFNWNVGAMINELIHGQKLPDALEIYDDL